MYGTSPASLTTVLTDSALVTAHSRTITGLTPGVTYYYKVSSTDTFTNAATAPPAPASFAVPAFVRPTRQRPTSTRARSGRAAS